MNLQSLFSEEIVLQTSLNGNASDVWLVKTESNEYVVRSSGVDDTIDAPFLWACRNLFGIDLSQTYRIENINILLEQITKNISFPRVLQKEMIDGRQVIVVEKMNGEKSKFLNKSTGTMEDFGKTMAEIHSYKLYECGCPYGDMRYPLEQFPEKLIEAIKVLTSRYYSSNPVITNQVDVYCTAALKMPIPKFASYIMLDMDPRQFLFNNNRVNAIVDTEAYVLGPREMDLVAIECSLDENGARAFRKGYTKVLSFPELSQIRELYRFLFCLLEIKGPSYDLKRWLSHPHYFS
ncbi:phosphotransferase [Paenibacillus sp. L3-i20]|uniref:phosphotransferase n=1 Tax=Paenibacillus sp. L3-i20 TaxID=2905833 RepID=UPI001EDC98A6|nr:phosphotransferase [Paenibacillus sp. L3-i20]GKU79196.1 hypothetical protein L3i20_v235930 [Paenibacillus sp. L3-i20]